MARRVGGEGTPLHRTCTRPSGDTSRSSGRRSNPSPPRSSSRAPTSGIPVVVIEHALASPVGIRPGAHEHPGVAVDSAGCHRVGDVDVEVGHGRGAVDHRADIAGGVGTEVVPLLVVHRHEGVDDPVAVDHDGWLIVAVVVDERDACRSRRGAQAPLGPAAVGPTRGEMHLVTRCLRRGSVEGEVRHASDDVEGIPPRRLVRRVDREREVFDGRRTASAWAEGGDDQHEGERGDSRRAPPAGGPHLNPPTFCAASPACFMASFGEAEPISTACTRSAMADSICE